MSRHLDCLVQYRFPCRADEGVCRRPAHFALRLALRRWAVSRTSGSAGTATWTTRPTAAAAGSPRTAPAHFFQLGFLLAGEDLVQPGIDIFLEIGDLFLLCVGQVQLILQEIWHDLTRLTWSAAAAAARTARTSAAGSARPSAARAVATTTALIFLLEQGD